MPSEEKPGPTVTNVGCLNPNDESQVPADTPTPGTQSSAAEDLTPRQDGGSGAWTFLTAASIVEMVAWGYPNCYGVFREYFFTHDPFKGVRYISVAGVMSNGTLQISLPFIIYFINNFPKYRKSTMWMGGLFCVASPLGGAFSTTPTQLITCLGPIYGLGAGMLFGPTMSYIAEWFDKKQSFAYGVICGMGGLSGAILPQIFTVSLTRYGYKTTLIGWAIAVFILTFPGLLFIKSRVPLAPSPKPKPSDFDFIRRPLFWILLLGTIIQALAYDVPSTFLASYALDFGIGPSKGSLLVSLLNLATAIGQPLQGLLADYRSSFWIPMMISTIGSSLEVLTIWGFSHTLWSLAIFSLLYGATAGGYAVLRPRFATAIIGHVNDKDQSLLVFGVLTAVRGAGMIASGFIASSQLDQSVEITNGYSGHRWLKIVVYTGVTMGVASLGIVGIFLSKGKTSKPTIEDENFS